MNKINQKEESQQVFNSVKSVRNYLSGENFNTLYDQEPQRKFCIGIMSPLIDDELGISEEKKKQILKRRPNSIGFETRILESNKPINLKISLCFSIYYRCIPSYEEQLKNINIGDDKSNISEIKEKCQIRLKYLKMPISVELNDLQIKFPKSREIQEIDCKNASNAINLKLEQVAKQIESKKDCWFNVSKEPTIAIAKLDSSDGYNESLPKKAKLKPNWISKITCSISPIRDNLWRFNLLFTNITDTERSEHPAAFFNCKLSCSLVNSSFSSFPFSASKLDYRYSTESWGRGINSVLKVSKDKKTASTVTLPIYEQPRIESRDNLQDACNFNQLGEKDTLGALIEVKEWLYSYYDKWDKDNKLYLKDTTYNIRVEDQKKYKIEIERYCLGLDSLENDKKLLNSFKLMNKSFAKTENESWRLFQLVFIVSQLPSLLARENKSKTLLESLNTVDVLWFPTGGGKTEAYFGVIITALFYDRFRGKKRGVTAWLKYPLRMLSIQQLQRLVNIITKADEIRKESSLDVLHNCDPFLVGYYVGQRNTPNYLTWFGMPKDNPIKVLKSITDNAKNVNEIPFLVLQNCPFCNSNNIEVKVDIKNIRIRHLCKDCKKEAPIRITDSELYRYAPAVIIGTIDRLARSGQTSLFSHIFGQFDKKCPKHGYLSFNKCIETTCDVDVKDYIDIEPIYDPCPSLIIQDELHLLKESLGTYDSHYETFIDLLSERIGNKLPPKRLAATATIEGYENHIWELYGRNSIRFPVKGIEEYDSAYIQQSKNTPGRIFVGVMPTGSSIEEIIINILENLKTISYLNFKNKKNDLIISNYDLSLTYVNEKNTAGNLQSKWEDLDDIKVVTGDKGLGEIRELISRIESDSSKDFDKRLKVLIATSVISHGVDLSRLNNMVFTGMPNHTSDYIQASSRVGRMHLGLVFTIFKPENNRERNIYQRFYEYHDRLYQLVQPVPINRFSKSSIERTLPGIMSSIILNIISHEIGKSLDKGGDFVKVYEEGIITDEEIVNLLIKSYAFNRFNMNSLDDSFFNNLINKLAKDQRRMILTNLEEYSTYKRMVPQPVSSLREVSEQIEFCPNYRSTDLLGKILRGRGLYGA